MKISRIFLATIIAASLSTCTAFADTEIAVTGWAAQNSIYSDNSKCDDNKDCKEKCKEFAKDPIKALQAKKEKVQALLKEGKITKEEADKKTAWIDSKIKEIESFNKLPLQQKKDKLISDCKAAVEKRVSEGKLDRAKADTILNEYTEKINTWDGTGYPKFRFKCFKDRFMKPDTDSNT